MQRPESVPAYLASLPPEQRVALEELRAAVRAAAPEATDAISYAMPAFRAHGRALVCYAAFKDHYSLFPMSTAAIAANEERLAPYRSGKGTLRFSYDEPLPARVVKDVVKVRLAELAARERR